MKAVVYEGYLQKTIHFYEEKAKTGPVSALHLAHHYAVRSVAAGASGSRMSGVPGHPGGARVGEHEVMETLAEVMLWRGIPESIRSDNAVRGQGTTEVVGEPGDGNAP